MSNLNSESQSEEVLYAEFKRKLNSEAAAARVAKLELDLCDATITKALLRRACQEANALKLGAVCVLPSNVKACVNFLGSDPQVSLIACISFPLGGETTQVKVAAVKRAIKDGVDEVEVTAPVSYIKDGNFSYVKREFKKLKSAAKNRAVRVNVESKYLTPQELTKVCNLAADCGITAVRTSSGAEYSHESVAQIKAAVKDRCLIKADGVTSLTDIDSAVDMGAGIIGSKCAADLAQLILNA